jgi:hypothetical protein
MLFQKSRACCGQPMFTKRDGASRPLFHKGGNTRRHRHHHATPAQDDAKKSLEK